MARAEIISEYGSGKYRVTRKWAGRANVQAEISELNEEIQKLQELYDSYPVIPIDENQLFEKNVIKLKITSRQLRVNYLTNKFPADETIDCWCADFSEGLTGVVGTIDIPGEFTDDVNIRPNSISANEYSLERDGDFYPSIAMGPWTTLLNKMILPGWQKFAPLHRYGYIVAGSIDYGVDTCTVAIPLHLSSQQSLNIQQGDQFGTVPVPGGEVLEHEFYKQDTASAHPGFVDFVERYPDHPISQVTELAPPVYMTDEQYIQIDMICRTFDYTYRYLSDQSGYEVSDHWDVMYDIGDTWYEIPRQKGDAQTIFNFGDVSITLDESGASILDPKYPDSGMIGPKQKRRGDCEDFVLTKMQAIIEAGIIPAANLQVLLCYVVNAGYHAVLGIQTQNRGFLISDQREYGQLWKIEQLSKTHMWAAFSIATAAGGSTVKWASTQTLHYNTPIEYMNCNSSAFIDDDHVIIEFTDQDWANPKVIGFVEEPVDCNVNSIFTFGINPKTADQYFAYQFDTINESWSVAGPTGAFAALRKKGCKVTRNSQKFFVTGGHTRGDDYPLENPQDTELWNIFHVRSDAAIYDAIRESWIIEPSYPMPKRDKHSGWYIDGEHFMCGGTNYPDGWLKFGPVYLQSDNQSHDVHTDLDAYKETEQVYEARESMPKALQRSADFVINQYGFIAGGNTKSYAYSPPDFWEYGEDNLMRYDSITNTWESREDLPKWRFDCVGFTINGKGYVVRGHESTGIFIDDSIEQIDIYPSDKPLEYNDDTETWEYKQDHSIRAWYQHLRGHASAELDDKGYSMSIDLSGSYHQNEKYDPLTDSWSEELKKPGSRISDLTAA